MIEGRTYKGLRNGRYAIILYLATLILGFFSRRAFIDNIGAEVLGMNATAMNLLGFLNIAELGIGSAVAFSLYKPLSEINTEEIREIVMVQGYLYKKIAYIIIGAATVLMLFFPVIFNNISFPLWYTFATFSAYLYSSLLTYFVNYKQIVLTANQEEYKIMYSYKSVLLFQSLCQILALYLLENGYVWWLVIQFLFATLASLSLNYVIKRDYPYLRGLCKLSKEVYHKHKIIITKTKQLFFHKIGAFVLEQSSPLIIFAYTSLTMVAIYTNYLLITNGILLLFGSVCNSVNAGIGNLVAEGDKKKIMGVFEEIFIIRFFFISVSVYCIYVLSPSFVTLWVGDEYILRNTTLLIMLGILFISLIRSTVDGFINAYGAYQDIYAPVIEAMISLSCAIALGYKYGIDGVLSGMFISQLLVIFMWKPYFLFKYAMRESVSYYVLLLMKSAIAFSISIAISNYAIQNIFAISSSNFFAWMFDAIKVTALISVILFVLLYSISDGMKAFASRIYNLVRGGQ